MRETVTTIIKGKVETKNVYLDTNVFVSAGFHYDSVTFEKLITLSQHGEVKLFTTRITVQEVYAKVRERVAEAVPAVKRCRQEASILWKTAGNSFDGLFGKINKDEVINELDERFNKFLTEANVEIISIAGLDVDAVFDDYFGFRPPFADGRKKSEFPDAFSAAAAERWCKENNEKMYLVSDDDDFVDVCDASERLISVRKPEALLNQFAISELNVAKFALRAFDALIPNLLESLGNSFEEQEFILEDQWGEVENVQCGTIDLINEFLIDADETEATFTIEANVDFEADVSFDDMDTAYRDDETREWIAIEKVEETIKRTVSVSAEVIISYDIRADIDSARIDSVSIENRNIKVRFDSIW